MKLYNGGNFKLQNSSVINSGSLSNSISEINAANIKFLQLDLSKNCLIFYLNNY